MKKWIKFILVPLVFLVFVGALVLIRYQFKNLNYVDILVALKTIPTFRLIIALLLSLVYYLILGGYDVIAFKYIKPENSLNPKNILFASFISNVLGSNTGYSMLFGGSVRYRLYSIYNVSIVDITKILIFSSATVWVGLLAIGGFVFTFAPIYSLKYIFNFSTRMVGLGFATVSIAYVILSKFCSKPLRVFKWTISFPNIKIVSLQFLFATFDWLIASLTLFILLPVKGLAYLVFLKVFLISQFLGIISQVPGGIGVFEASITLMLPNYMNKLEFLGGMLAYRSVFYFFPLLIALILLVYFEIVTFTKRLKNSGRVFWKSVSSLVVQFITLSSFILGIVLMLLLLLAPLKLIKNVFMSKVVDLAHFLLSIVAISLLFISRALYLRVKNAWGIAYVLISFAIIFMFILGEHRMILLCFVILFVALLLSKKYFYKNIPIFNAIFNVVGISVIGGIFILLASLGFFVNRYDIYSLIDLNLFPKNILSSTDIARFLRVILSLVIMVCILILDRVLRVFFKKSCAFKKDYQKNIVKHLEHTSSFNALILDKSYIMSDKKIFFIMYAKLKINWIVKSDPIEESKYKEELLRKFKEIANNVSAKLDFIGISQKYLRTYNDVGLEVFSIVQEIKIYLDSFGKKASILKIFVSWEKEWRR
ncbi:MAG: phosphatidylglycerol lysyltransferase domain-containing protein [Endomicrobium sp.]|jgi:phosphatidylglycerol lysyltransferase|nr:phosphatidylglycerol lysyltransferase domain-containing protein [Endomicrobium sp.]